MLGSDHKGDIRGIRLENICDTSNQQAADESVVPDALPAFLHVLLAGLDAKQPTSRGVVVITMVGGTEVGSSREALNALGPAQQAARTEDVRQGPGSHVEDGGVRGLVKIGKPGEVGGCKLRKQGQQSVALPMWQQQSQLEWHHLEQQEGEGLFGSLMLKPQKADGELDGSCASPFRATFSRRLFMPGFIGANIS